MPRVCTVCAHPKRKAIDRALVAGEPYRRIAARFQIAESSLRRHKERHLPGALVQAQGAGDIARADDLLAELQRLRQRVNKLFDACDAWLTDPEDPSRYELGPRAADVKVTYEVTEPGAGGRSKTVRRKAKLSALLALVNKTRDRKLAFVLVETKYADPRKLVLDAAQTLQGQLDLIARLIGEMPAQPTINVLVAAPEWLVIRARLLRALEPYPEARAAVVTALGESSAG